MRDKEFWKYNKKKILLCIVFTFLIFFYCSFVIFNYMRVKKYDDTVLPNSYLQDYAIGDYSYFTLNEFINFINGIVDDQKVTFLINGQEVSYKYSEVGLYLNTNKIIKNIEIFQNELSYTDKIQILYDNDKIMYSYQFTYNSEKLIKFLNNLKIEIENSNDSFSLDVDKSFDVIVKSLDTNIVGKKVELIGNVYK